MYHLTEKVKVYERDDWNARTPRPMDSQALPTEAFIHHGAETDREAVSVDTLADVFAAMRGIQNYHMDHNEWSDIAYAYVCFQARGDGELDYAVLCEGRHVHNVPAAQLGHNTGTLPVCVYGTVDHNDPLQGSTVHAIAMLLKGHRADLTGAGHVRTVGGHRDVTQTDCPGDMLYHAIPTIARNAGISVFHRG